MKTSEKAKKRLESKKRKVSAFLQVAALNDESRRAQIIDAKEESSDQDEEKISQPSSKKPLLSGDSYEELRQRLKARKKLLMQIPTFELKTVGNEAEIDMPENFRTPLFMKDLQELFLYALMGTKAPVEPCRWAKFTRWCHLKGVLCLVVEGFGLQDFYDSRETDFSTLAPIFKFKLEFLAPATYNSQISQDFALLPAGKNLRNKLSKKYGSIASAVEQGSAYRVLKSVFPVKNSEPTNEIKEVDDKKSMKLKLLLSLSQMLEQGYPVPLSGATKKKFKGFIFTKSEYAEVTENSPLFSIDCEMCLTSASKMELTKICVINSDLEVVYLTFVKPKNAIRNYMTKFSGITKEMLEGVTTTLEDVQKAITELLPPDAILIGQSLNSDLCAMQMMHPYVIDTSVIYCITGSRSRKSKLSVLSKTFLGEAIQHDKEGSHIGHDPKEDAEAAMKLVLLKIENGYNFGDVLLDGTIPNRDEDVKDGKIVASTIFNHAKGNNQSVCIVGQDDILSGYKKYSIGAVAEVSNSKEGDEDSLCGVIYSECNSSTETVEKCKEVSSKHDLTICHVQLPKLVEDTDSEKIKKKNIKYLKKWTDDLWTNCQENGLFVTVWTGDKTQNAFVGIALKKASVPKA